MKTLILNIKNMIPYLVLIFIYFLFVNIEARKKINILQHKKSNINKDINAENSLNNDNLKISIPVIPYNH